jgi:ADP-heptose:LPS heptosyltransferase
MIMPSIKILSDILQKIHSGLLKIYCKYTLPTTNEIGENILIFADMGIGNLIWFYPFIKSIESLNITVAINNKEVSELIKFNIPNAEVVTYSNIPNKKYDVVVANFLCQTNIEVYEIIKRKIPCRIGHAGVERMKYAWLFNYSYKMDNSRQETISNLELLIPFKMEKKYGHLKLPEREITDSYDILIQPHSSYETRKDWKGYKELVTRLKNYNIAFVGSKNEREFISENFPDATNLAGKYDLIGTAHIIKNSKLIIGNDSGLVKVADGLGCKSIQIFYWWSEYIVLAKTYNGINLIEPTIDEVINQVETLFNSLDKQ